MRALTLSRYLGFKVLTAHTCPTSQPKEQSHNLRKSLECAYNSEPCIHTASTLSFDGMRGKGIGEEQSVSHQKSDSLTCGILYSSRRGSVSAENADAVPVTMARDFLCLWQL